MFLPVQLNTIGVIIDNFRDDLWVICWFGQVEHVSNEGKTYKNDSISVVSEYYLTYVDHKQKINKNDKVVYLCPRYVCINVDNFSTGVITEIGDSDYYNTTAMTIPDGRALEFSIPAKYIITFNDYVKITTGVDKNTTSVDKNITEQDLLDKIYDILG